MSVKLDISEIGRLGKLVDTGLQNAAKRATLGTAHRIVAYITTSVIPQTKPYPPVDKRIYAAGFRARPTSDGGAEIVNTVPYAAPIEFGVKAGNVRAGPAMRKALVEWILRKNIAGELEDARPIAFFIIRKMKKKGIFNQGKGLRVLERGVARLDEFFYKEFMNELKKEFPDA